MTTARRLAFDVLRRVSSDQSYANLELNKRLGKTQLDQRDTGFATELVAGTCRGQGTYDRIITAASGRKLGSLQPAVIDLLRLGTHQLLSMDVPNRAAVASTVELARSTVGQRVTGLVNAILRKVSAKSYSEWVKALTEDTSETEALALEHMHPSWIVQAYAELLPANELGDALAANNTAPQPTLVWRPGVSHFEDLTDARPTRFSPYGAVSDVPPARQPAVASGHAGVQDEGSQLMAVALARADAPKGPWLDLCAGPGGKAALLAGLAAEVGTELQANELQHHRADLVREAVRHYDNVTVSVANGTQPSWAKASFARVLADVPCSGLGALRRRPDSRWRKTPEDLDELQPLQRALLNSALDSAMPGGVVAYVTCSPHRLETSAVVEAVLADRADVEVLQAAQVLAGVPQAAAGPYVQLWPHRHGTDAMFLALLRRT